MNWNRTSYDRPETKADFIPPHGKAAERQHLGECCGVKMRLETRFRSVGQDCTLEGQRVEIARYQKSRRRRTAPSTMCGFSGPRRENRSMPARRGGRLKVARAATGRSLNSLRDRLGRQNGRILVLQQAILPARSQHDLLGRLAEKMIA